MNKNSYQEQAYQIIRRRIIFCDYIPDQKISENDLTEQLNIGRTPIREAIIRLQKENLLYILPKSGTYVSKIRISSAENARFTREHLERIVMMECCSKITATDRKNIKKILTEQKRAIETHDKKILFKTDNEFHQYFYKIADKEEIWDWQQITNSNLSRFRWLSLTINHQKNEEIISQHQRIFQAVLDGKPEEVSFLTATHLHLLIEEKDLLIEKFPNYFM